MKLLFLSILSLLSIQVIAQFSHYTWVHDLKVRSSPSTSSDVLEKLKEGEGISYLDEKSSKSLTAKLRGKSYTDYWWKIKTQSGKLGWVFGAALQENAPMPKLYAWVNDLRVRDKAGFEGTTVSKLAEGTEVKFTGKRSQKKTSVKLRGTSYNDYWIKVRLNDGSKGWVHAAALRYQNDDYHDPSAPVLMDLSSASNREAWWNGLSSEWKQLFRYVNSDAASDLYKIVNLKEIDISDDDACATGPMHSIDFKNLKGLSQLTQLEMINASYTEFDNLKALQHLKELKTLYLEGANFKNLEGIEQLSNLRTLDVDIKNKQDLKRIAKLSKLQTLSISLSGDTEDAIDLLSNLKNLSSLVITWVDNEDFTFDLNILKNTKNLTWLQINSMNAKNFDAFENLYNLKSVNIRTKGSIDLYHLRNSTNLEYLTLDASSISNWETLSNCNKLATVSIITYKLDLNDLSIIPNLNVLDLSIDRLSSLRGIEKQKNLEYLYLGYSREYSDLEPLLSLPKLKTVTLSSDLYDRSLNGKKALKNKGVSVVYNEEVGGC